MAFRLDRRGRLEETEIASMRSVATASLHGIAPPVVAADQQRLLLVSSLRILPL
jgi:hypothetical protein